MATKNYTRYIGSGSMAHATHPAARMAEAHIDFTETGNQVASASDTLALFNMPKGSVVLAGGVEQVVAGSSGNTVTARIGTIALSGTLASDAAVGTITANADVSGGAPVVITADSDFSLLSATGIRATGVVRAFVVFVEGKKDTPAPALAQRVQ